jgi:4-amino-4-deoxy-L-arabinose transferase-like glycosyltransferase
LENLKESSQQKKETSRISPKSIHITRQTTIVIILAVAAFLLKFYLLYERFIYVDPDEAYYIILARNLLTGNGYAFNGLPNVVFPPFLPLLIALFYLICQDFQYSLIIITALSGALLGVISYKIAGKKFSSLIPIFCAFIVLFIYQLNSFLPLYLTSYIGRLYRGSDILNCLLILASIYFVICLAEKDKYRFALLAGGSFALSYLTRPEGLLLFLIILVCLAFLKIISLISISYKRLLVFLFAFVLLSSPYILYLKNTTGKWNLSGKISSSQDHREALLEVIRNDYWIPFSNIHYAFDKENMEMVQGYFGFHNKLEATSKISFQSFLKNIPENLRMYPIIPKILLPPYIMVFFLLGFAAAAYKIVKRKSTIDIILFMFLPYSLLIEGLSYPIPRHHLFLVPFFCIYAVEGVILASSALARKKKAFERTLLIVIISIIILFIVYDYKANLSLNNLKNPSFRKPLSVNFQISQYLKKRKAQTIMSIHPSFAAMALSDWQVSPQASLFDIIRFGKHKRVDYIVHPEPNGNVNFYNIIDMKNSYIPQDSSDEFGYIVIEQTEYFQLLNLVKKK